VGADGDVKPARNNRTAAPRDSTKFSATDTTTVQKQFFFTLFRTVHGHSVL
jgi:hypothetical protein